MAKTTMFRLQRGDVGLLYLRVVAGASLLLKHGLEKPMHFTLMAQHFPDPIGIGPVPSLLFALLSDCVCSLLIIVGIGTRIASLVVMVNLLTAWVLVHHFVFFGPNSDHGELIVLYLSAFGCLLLSGGGDYTLDRLLKTRRF